MTVYKTKGKNMLSSHELRKKYLDFFAKRKHTIRPSASLIPLNDPSLLFTSAGMVPFKDMFQGKVPLEYTRAASIQKCVRTTDIDNVGHTQRHLTFFEMMGNFSFGDYFKEDAIKWAWEFLTQELKLSKDRLYVTIFKDDNEALQIWSKIIDPKRIYKLGEDTNFWTIGETGPCGPCSEIIYDLGKEIGCGKSTCEPGCDCDRFLEVWNLVFTQFDKQKNGSLKELPKKNIDTGMGLERLACVVQNVHSPYETDVLKTICNYIIELQKEVNSKTSNETALRIISDHARTITFLLSDGVFPSNDGRGYVLKRLIRRAIIQGQKLGLKNFLHKISNKVIGLMKDSYPELLQKHAYCMDIIQNEEKKFEETLSIGVKILDELKLKYKKQKLIPGDEVFKLFDTFGMPVDIVKEIAESEGFNIDEKGFEKVMEEQKIKNKKNITGWDSEDNTFKEILSKYGTTEFVGYDSLESQGEVICIVFEKQFVKEAKTNQEIGIILNKTSFFGENGGQIGDKGTIALYDNNKNIKSEIQISDTKKIAGSLIIHYGKITKGEIKLKDKVNTKVDIPTRNAISKNHTATHLLQAILRKNLGSHIEQSGSEVRDDGFRFDFTHPKSISKELLDQIEIEVNTEIQNNYPVNVIETSFDEAKKTGALAFFGEKYGQKVRVCSIKDNDTNISVELCGGVHVNRTGDIGLFKILSETSIAGGIRRIECVTGLSAINWMQEKINTLNEISNILKSPIDDISKNILLNISKIKNCEKEIENLKLELIKSNIDEIIKNSFKISDVNVLIHSTNASNIEEIRSILDILKNKLKNPIIVLLTEKIPYQIICYVNKEVILKQNVDAKKIVNVITEKFGGGGGGKPEQVQAGLKTDASLTEILEFIKTKIKDLI
jgi:alanyl-tRNA synthetase